MATFDEKTGEFDGELNDVDLYNLLLKTGVISETMFTLPEFLMFSDLIRNGYDENVALELVYGYRKSQEISKKYGQDTK